MAVLIQEVMHRQLYDLTGKKLLDRAGIDGSTVQISVDHLKHGLYLLAIIQENRMMVTKKIIISK